MFNKRPVHSTVMQLWAKCTAAIVIQTHALLLTYIITPRLHSQSLVIWTKTETVFVWGMSAPEEFCLSRAIQMFALLLLLLLLYTMTRRKCLEVYGLWQYQTWHDYIIMYIDVVSHSNRQEWKHCPCDRQLPGRHNKLPASYKILQKPLVVVIIIIIIIIITLFSTYDTRK